MVSPLHMQVSADIFWLLNIALRHIIACVVTAMTHVVPFCVASLQGRCLLCLCLRRRACWYNGNLVCAMHHATCSQSLYTQFVSPDWFLFFWFICRFRDRSCLLLFSSMASGLLPLTGALAHGSLGDTVCQARCPHMPLPALLTGGAQRMP